MMARALVVLLLMGLVFPVGAWAAELGVEIVNNQPFDIWMPIRLRGVTLEAGAQITSEQTAVQQSGDDVIMIADVPASKTKVTKIVDGTLPTSVKELELVPVSEGISLRYK